MSARLATAYLGLGSNLGDREHNLTRAVALMAPAVVVRRLSALYETAPVGYLAQGLFLNAVAETRTALAPPMLLSLLKDVERQLGRGPAERWGPRVVDVDILSYGDAVCDSPELTLPHPRLAERAFVLVPLAEIAPGWRHPVLGRTAAELLADLGAAEGVRLYRREWAPR